MTTTIETNTDAMLAAHALCGQLIENMPDDFVFTSWEIMPGYVGGAYSTLDSTHSAKRGLAILANQFGLVYAEETKPHLVSVTAAGEIDGVQVQLWAHIGVPQPSPTDGES